MFHQRLWSFSANLDHYEYWLIQELLRDRYAKAFLIDLIWSDRTLLPCVLCPQHKRILKDHFLHYFTIYISYWSAVISIDISRSSSDCRFANCHRNIFTSKHYLSNTPRTYFCMFCRFLNSPTGITEIVNIIQTRARLSVGAYQLKSNGYLEKRCNEYYQWNITLQILMTRVWSVNTKLLGCAKCERF